MKTLAQIKKQWLSTDPTFEFFLEHCVYVVTLEKDGTYRVTRFFTFAGNFVASVDLDNVPRNEAIAFIANVISEDCSFDWSSIDFGSKEGKL